MSSTMALIAVILFLLLIGSRLFVVVGVATVLSFIWILQEGTDVHFLVRIVNKMESLTTKNVFLSIPLFIAAGTIMTRGGMAKKLIAITQAVVGFLPGGLAIASVLACIIFAAISGSSPVTLVAVGSIMFPALLNHGYPERPVMGLLTTAGSLGCLVPPSIAMLIYAICVSGSAAVDPADLFIAGLVPAVGITLMLCVYAFIIGRKVPQARMPFSWHDLLHALQDGFFAVLLPFVVLGGIYSGQFTPTEAGAVALVYSVFVCVVVHQEMSLQGLYDAFVESAVLMGSLILIIVLAFGLNDFLAEIEAAEKLGLWLQGAQLTPFQFLLVVNVALIVVGALMDSVSATLVFAPLLAPIALTHYGIDPLHFGVIFVVNMEIGYLAPPVATNLFVGAAIFKRPFVEVAKAVMPTLAMVCVALFVLMIEPTFSKGILNWRADKAVYEAFPWAGKKMHHQATSPMNPSTVSPSSTTSSDNSVSPTPSSGKVMTMEEMMKAADAVGSQPAEKEPVAESSSSSPSTGKVMTMEEMMKAADAMKKETSE